MADTIDQEPAANPRKRQALDAGLEADDDKETRESENIKGLKKINSVLEAKNRYLNRQIKELNEKHAEAQRVFDARNGKVMDMHDRLLETVQDRDERINELIDTQGKLEAKLGVPLLDKETIEWMVGEDETLRIQRWLALRSLLCAKERATKDYQEEETSRKEWGKSIWHWQELRDIQRPDCRKYADNDWSTEPLEWTTKEIFENRQEQVDEFREGREVEEQRMKELEVRMGKIDEQRIKAWRDIVLGNLGEKEKDTVPEILSNEEETDLDPISQNEEDLELGSDFDSDAEPVGIYDI
jgi:hypothetical protein